MFKKSNKSYDKICFSTFIGYFWGHNGPGVITRVLKRKCMTDDVLRMPESDCQGFSIYPTEYFAPFSYNDPEFFFQEGNTDLARKISNHSYTIHYWNKMSSKFILKNNLDIPFFYYALNYCPKIYKASNGKF